MHNKCIKFLLVSLVSILIVIMPVMAHVTLNPREAVVGRQVYEVRVPNERPNASTIEVRLIVPKGITASILPSPGWVHSEVKEPSTGGAEQGEVLKEITWSGGRIDPGEYMSFYISTNYQGNATTLFWKAYQKYSSGEVVGWVNESGTTLPAPKVKILNESGIDTLTKSVNQTMSALNGIRSEQQRESNQRQRDSNQLAWVSGAAILFSVVSLVISLKGTRKK